MSSVIFYLLGFYKCQMNMKVTDAQTRSNPKKRCFQLKSLLVSKRIFMVSDVNSVITSHFVSERGSKHSYYINTKELKSFNDINNDV